MKGTVKWFNASKGYGFIAGEDSKEYFIHISEIGEGVSLRENDAVEFEPGSNDRGPQAKKIKLA